jgi:UDP-N-acetylglucosamine 2-epimerase (hydrolysing)
MEALAAHGQDIIVIESNNDWGSEKIRQAYASHQSNPKFHFFPSMRFEYFLAILRNAKFMIGNSSAGIREAPHYGVPTINLGTRQHNRVRSSLVLNTEISREAISESLQKAGELERVPEKNFGDGRSVERFIEIVQSAERWSSPIQKQFVDRPSQDGKEKK